MTIQRFFSGVLLAGALSLFASCGNNEQAQTPSEGQQEQTPDIKEEAVTYTSGKDTLKGYVAYDANRKEQLPIVLVVHEWWGLTEYPRTRAKQLAELGYLAFSADIYSGGKLAPTPPEAQAAATPFYQNPQLAKTRLDAALEKAKSYPQADTARTAAIGYCFGGAVVLNAARLGANLDGVVSFHGNLVGTPARKDLLKSAILVCHGGADNFVPDAEVAAFKKSMDSIGADYTFKVYPGATHAFTNPNATEVGQKFNMPVRYDAQADSASWNDMKEFFGKIFH
ncbi:dienelactone hydrolase family protein [Paraflavisolibacter sp. H34]|uniref:dienelactone hydrolase family protein n=1 Tax=Huijunlia imazamoxiresistens TaxID=3127457 RepID=UPI003015A090